MADKKKIAKVILAIYKEWDLETGPEDGEALNEAAFGLLEYAGNDDEMYQALLEEGMQMDMLADFCDLTGLEIGALLALQTAQTVGRNGKEGGR